MIQPLRFPDLAASLVAVCDALGLGAPIVVGHSFGGLAAVVAAGWNQGRFAGAMAIDPYLSNADVRGAHGSMKDALSEARELEWSVARRDRRGSCDRA